MDKSCNLINRPFVMLLPGLLLTIQTIIVLSQFAVGQPQTSNEVEEAQRFLQYYDNLAAETWPKIVQKMWNFNNNMTDITRSEMLEARKVYSTFSQQGRVNASQFNTANFSESIKRQLRKIIVNVGENAFTDKQKLQELKDIKSRMKTRYSTASACKAPGKKADVCMPFAPDAERLMASSRNYTELLHLWTSWRDANGPGTQGVYERYVELSNLAANDNDQPDKGAMWRSWYEVDNLEDQVDNIYRQLQPLYMNLHAYVRRKLYRIYGPKFVNLRGPIAAHLLGHMWASKWTNLIDIAKPFPQKKDTDITPALQRQGYTVRQMFDVANEFYTSMGLLPVPAEFFNKSRVTRPTDGRPVLCHASAWDFYDKKDFRISMCADVNMDDFLTVHHELGHVQYFNQYRDQPIVYRLSACPAFGEAVGDTVAMSVISPQHLHKIDLLDELIEDQETELNFLMIVALEKIAYLPFAIMVDKWRWSVFNGSTPRNQYNTKWWQLRTRFQGITPPVARDEADFDPASIYHVSADVSYIRYFLAYVVQFQFHQGLCKHAGHTGPLYRCDIYNSTDAGLVFSEMLRMGISRPWPEAMAVVTGQRNFDAAPLVQYFEPLTDWLKEQNRQNGDEPGWPDDNWIPPLPPEWTSGCSSMRTTTSTISWLCASLLTYRLVLSAS